MLGQRVGGVAGAGQQPGGRAGLQEVALAAPEHGRQRRARRVHVRHDIDRPGQCPVLVAGVQAPPEGHPRVRADEVHLPEPLQGGGHQGTRLRLGAHVGAHGHAADAGPLDLGGHFTRPRLVEVGHHHRTRALGGEAAGHGRADPAPAAGHHHDLALKVHAPSPSRRHARSHPGVTISRHGGPSSTPDMNG